MKRFQTGVLSIVCAVVLLFPIAGWPDDAGTSSGEHGGGYDLELPEGATGPTPAADCLALPQQCTANNYGNSESDLPSTNNCDPKCDVWNPSDSPGYTVSPRFVGDPRNYIYSSWRYPRLFWREENPDSPGNEIWRSGTLSDSRVHSIRFPFRGGSVFAGTIASSVCEGCGGDSWDRTNAALVLSDTPGGSSPLGGQFGCSIIGSGGIQFVDGAILELYKNHRQYENIKNLYCVMNPGEVYYATYFPNNVQCGTTQTCRIVLDVLPSGVSAYWDPFPHEDSDLLPNPF